METYFYIIIAVVLILMLFILIKISSRKSKGKAGEKAVAKVLKKCKGKSLNGICLPLYDSITEIDHIFIGKMGIVIIETKNISGSVCGNVCDSNWTHNIGSKTHKLYSPIFQNKTHYDNVIYHLRKMGISNVPIYSVIVFADKNISINISGKANIIKIDKLKSYISNLPISGKYIPVGEIYSYLKTIDQKSPLKLYNHNKKIQKRKI